MGGGGLRWPSVCAVEAGDDVSSKASRDGEFVEGGGTHFQQRKTVLDW